MPTNELLPANISYGTAIWHFGSAPLLPGDADGFPDFSPGAGVTVTFTASTAAVVDASAAGGPVTIEMVPIVCGLDSQGWLVGGDGQRGVKLIATNDPDLNPTGWTYNVTFLRGGQKIAAARDFYMELPSGTTKDLALAMPIPSSAGVSLNQAQAAEAAAVSAASQASAAAAAAAASAATFVPATVDTLGQATTVGKAIAKASDDATARKAINAPAGIQCDAPVNAATDTAHLAARFASASSLGIPVVHLAQGTYLLTAPIVVTSAVRIIGHNTTIKLANGSLVNTDSTSNVFVPLLRAQGVSSLHIEGVTFDHNRDNQTYPATVNTFGRGSSPFRHNAAVEITPGSDNTTRSTNVNITRCKFINGYMSGLALWQVSIATVTDCDFLNNTWSGMVGCQLDVLCVDNVRGYRNGVSSVYTQARKDGDRATIQIREFTGGSTSTNQGLPTVPSATSVANGTVRISNVRSTEDAVEAVFVRASRDCQMRDISVVDVGYGRPTTTSYFGAGVWFEWGSVTMSDIRVQQKTLFGAGIQQPDGIVAYTFTGDGAPPISLQGSYQSVIDNPVVFCGQEFPLASGTYTDNANKLVNFNRGIRCNTAVTIRNPFIEGCASSPIQVIDDDNYQHTSPSNVHIRDGIITNFTSDYGIEITRYGTADAGSKLTVKGVRIEDGRSATTGTATRALIWMNTNIDGHVFDEVDISSNQLDCRNTADTTLPYVGVQVRGASTSKGVRVTNNQIRGAQRPVRVSGGVVINVDDNQFIDCSRMADVSLTSAIGQLSVSRNTVTGLVSVMVDFTFNSLVITQFVFTGNNVTGTTATAFGSYTVGGTGITRAQFAPNMIKAGANFDLRRSFTAAPTVDAWHQGEIAKVTTGTSTAYLAVTTGAGASDWVAIN